MHADSFIYVYFYECLKVNAYIMLSARALHFYIYMNGPSKSKQNMRHRNLFLNKYMLIREVAEKKRK